VKSKCEGGLKLIAQRTERPTLGKIGVLIWDYTWLLVVGSPSFTHFGFAILGITIWAIDVS